MLEPSRARLRSPDLKYLAVDIAQDGNEHARRRIAIAPVDVEVPRVTAFDTVLEHIPPPRVARALRGHVVGHDVEHLAQTTAAKLLTHAVMRLETTELDVDRAVVDDVVAVRAALCGLQIGGRIEMAHAEIGKVLGDPGDAIETETRMQLHPIGTSDRTIVGRSLHALTS